MQITLNLNEDIVKELKELTCLEVNILDVNVRVIRAVLNAAIDALKG
jgi:hypothetical protein